MAVYQVFRALTRGTSCFNSYETDGRGAWKNAEYDTVFSTVSHIAPPRSTWVKGSSIAYWYKVRYKKNFTGVFFKKNVVLGFDCI